MYHIPVMAKESIDYLVQNESGCYVDLTFGGGGYSAQILSKLNTGKLYAFDQDSDAEKNLIQFEDDDRLQFIKGNFRHVKRYLRMFGVSQVDGIVADLGVSSHQFDEEARGFSFRLGGELDMRMSSDQEETAADILNSYSKEELHRVFGEYGEVKNAKTLAEKIVVSRHDESYEKIERFLEIIEPLAPKNREYRYYSQVFQALRIEVNKEMEALKEMLEQVPYLLKEDGRVVIVSYHSLEDRLVKNFIMKGKFSGQVEKDFYGNDLKPLDAIERKALMPDQQEIDRNSRARSAKMRIAKRNKQQWPITS